MIIDRKNSKEQFKGEMPLKIGPTISSTPTVDQIVPNFESFGGLEQKVMANQVRDIVNAMRDVETAKTKIEKHPWDELNDYERLIWFKQAANTLNMEKLNMVIAASIQAIPDWREKFKNISSHDFNTKKTTLCDAFYDLATEYLILIKLSEIHNEGEAGHKKWEARAAAELREKDEIIEKQEIEIADLEKKLEDLEIDNSVKEGKIRDLESDYTVNRGKAASLEKKIKDLKIIYTVKRGKSASLEKTIKDLEIENTVKEGMVLEKEIDTASLEKKIKDLEIENAVKRGKMASLEKKFKDLEIENIVKTGKTASFEKTIKDLEIENTVKEGMVSEEDEDGQLTGKVEDLEIKNPALREEGVKEGIFSEDLTFGI